MTTVLDPTAEAAPAERTLLERPTSIEGLTVGLLDISKPRGDVFLDQLETHLTARGATVERFTQADLHQAGPDRPPLRDRPALPRGHRGARRLRLLHVVQCARHR